MESADDTQLGRLLEARITAGVEAALESRAQAQRKAWREAEDRADHEVGALVGGGIALMLAAAGLVELVNRAMGWQLWDSDATLGACAMCAIPWMLWRMARLFLGR